MMMKYLYVSKYPKVFLKMTGLTVEEFDELLKTVKPIYQQAELKRLSYPNRQRAIGGGQSAELDERDQILLSVVWLRVYPTHDVLGYFFGVSQPTVGRYISRVLPVLAQTGQDTMRMPDPGRKRRRSLATLLKEMPELVIVIDSFEQKVQRPKAAAVRDDFYSGKKKTHTLKSQVAVDEETGEIVDVSVSVPGPTADLSLLKASGLLERLPDKVGGIGDSGYQGLDKLHDLGFSPRKKPRGKDRPPEDVAFNTAFSRRRIIVENTNCRLRRYQALTQTDRNHRQGHTQRVLAVAGLVNLQLRSRFLL
jgi:hypothetical protein